MRIVSLLLACAIGCMAADQNEKQQVVAAVNKLFEAMSAASGDAIAATMTPDAKLIAVADDKVAPPRTRDDFVQRIAASKSTIVERMWKPTVLVRGRIATVWAEYDVHVGGKFGHCGIDAFMLVKGDDGWKISSIEYTSETQGCKPSPLGPLHSPAK
jgi:ketosteroid isomerase-like protein